MNRILTQVNKKGKENVGILSKSVILSKCIKYVKKNRKYQILAEQLEAILDHIPALIFYKDRHNNFIKVNKYAAQTYQKEKRT